MRKRERLEEDRVNHTKYCGVRPNSERKGEDGDQGKPGRFAELPEREAEVVHGK